MIPDNKLKNKPPVVNVKNNIDAPQMKRDKPAQVKPEKIEAAAQRAADADIQPIAQPAPEQQA